MTGEFVRDHVEDAIARARLTGDDEADAVVDALRTLGLDATPDTIPAAADDSEPGWCEWPTQSGWRTATCGRSGARASVRWGIRLCWQHEDAVISEALARIKQGRGHYRKVLDALVEVAKDDLLRPRHAAWTDAIDDEIIRRLTEGAYLSERVKDAFDEYIDRAIREKWSA